MTSPLSPEAVAQMVADREAGTPGPWAFEIDDDTQEPRLYWDGSLIAVFGNYMTISEAAWIPEADARRATRLPDLEAAYLTLSAENATLRAENEELDFLRHEGGPDSVAAMEIELATLRASEAAAQEREGNMRQALQAAMDDTPGWYDLARDARNASLSARTQRLIARSLTPTADKEPKP